MARHFVIDASRRFAERNLTPYAVLDVITTAFDVLAHIMPGPYKLSFAPHREPYKYRQYFVCLGQSIYPSPKIKPMSSHLF